jgi:DNA helicase-2/ATP-dependent DNA helicase PcrA
VKERVEDRGDAASDVTIATFTRLPVLGAETKAFGDSGKYAILIGQTCEHAAQSFVRSVGPISTSGRSWANLRRKGSSSLSCSVRAYRRIRRGDEVVYPRYVSALKSFRAFDLTTRLRSSASLEKTTGRAAELAYRYMQVLWTSTKTPTMRSSTCAVADGHRNLCVVGDDDQSIYAWRGADVRNILEFERHFEGAKVVKLQSNYRSTAAILAVANAVIASSRAKRHAKTLVATQGEGERVRVVVAADEDVEASYVADHIEQCIRSGDCRPGDIAVLYRSNGQADLLETCLRERNILYRVAGGTQFYERKEVKDMLAYMRCCSATRRDFASKNHQLSGARNWRNLGGTPFEPRPCP